MEVGDRVACRFWNTPEQCFYGDEWTGTVIDKWYDYSLERYQYLIERDSGLPDIEVQLKEIRRRLS